MSKRLNNLINECDNVRVNYSTSFLDFLKLNADTNVIARLLYKHWIYKHGRPAYRYMITTNEIDYITFRNDGTISYLPNGKEHVKNDDGTWSKDNRQNGKPAKVIRKLFTARAQKLLKDSDFESFTNKYKSAFNNESFTFSIIPNTEIANIYRLSSAKRMQGDASLNESCMNNENRNFFDIYTNCKSLRMVVCYNADNLLAGRALLWNLKDSEGNDVVLLDRIYAAQDFIYELFINYAKKNNMWRKVKYSSRSEQQLFYTPNDVRMCESFRVYTPTDFDAYPYIDTFQYGGNGFLSNDNDGTCYEYDCTAGGRSGDSDEYEEEENNTIWDEINDEDISEDDAIQIERGSHRGQWTHVNETVNIGCYVWYREDEEIIYLSSRGQYYHRDDVVYCEHDSEDYHIDDCVETIDNEWILSNESITTEDGNVYHEDDDRIIEIDNLWYEKDSDDVCFIDSLDAYYLKSDDSIIEIDGDYYHIDEDDIISIDGNYYHISDDNIIEIDGKWYMKDSDAVIEIDGNFKLRQLSFAFDTTIKAAS
jgi:hypothetical protein